MEITNLLKQKPETGATPEVFLAIQIQEGLIKTALWQIDSGLPQILSFGSPQTYTEPEALPEVIDVSISHCLTSSEVEPNRVIFGVPESWFKDDQISPEYKEIITTITKQLDLKPVGLVSLTDAIITHLKEKEGIPPSVIFVEVGDTKVNIVVVRLGQVKGREEVDRSDDLAADVAEGLARIDTDQLPSRILVINGNDVELEQQLISYSWMDKFPFLHLPKVEVPDPHFSIEAVALCGGGEAARSLGLEISELSPPAVEEPKTELVDGFVIDQNINEISEPIVETAPLVTPAFNRPKINFKIPSFPKLPTFRLPKKNFLVFIPLVLVALVTLIYLLFLFVLNSATIELKVTPYKLSKSINLAIGKSSDPSLPVLDASQQVYEIEKTDSLETTGEAVVGEKASGEVVIFNKTDTVKTLAKGTVLTTTNNLKFYLDESVDVASKSASSTIDIATGTQTINLGKATVKVSAAKIGTESNLASNTSLSVAAFPLSSLEAKVNSELTGGTARTVRAVSDADQKRLLDRVVETVKQEAAAKVAQSTSEQAVPTSDIKFVKQTYNKGVGEEAQNLTLTLKATVTLLQYKPEELRLLLASNLSSDIPTGYQLNSDQVNISLQNVVVDKNDQVTATAIVEGKLMPVIDIQQYKQQIKGKSVASARQLFESVVGYTGANFNLGVRPPFMANRMPFAIQKITINVSASE